MSFMKAKERKQKSAWPEPVEPIVQVTRRSKRDPLQPGRKPIIMLAVPSATGHVNFSIALAFARAMASNAVPECPYRFIVHMEVGKRPIDHARNCIVKVFLEETDADWLYMIDDDQVVPENFWELCLIQNADIVSALTPVWVGNMDPETMLRVNNYSVDEKGQCYNLPIPKTDVKTPYRVPIAGTGCLAIRRRVFAPKPAGVGQIPFYFTFQDDRKIRGGEDINFSVDCNRAGFAVAINPNVWFDHMKEMSLLQVERFYQGRKAMELSGRQPTEAQRLSIG